MISFRLSHPQRVALASKIFDIGFALLTPFPRVSHDPDTSSSTLPATPLETLEAVPSSTSSSVIPSSLIVSETPLLETSLDSFVSSSCTCCVHFVESVVDGLNDVMGAIEEASISYTRKSQMGNLFSYLLIAVKVNNEGRVGGIMLEGKNLPGGRETRTKSSMMRA
jgi:hypothetical protein